MKFRINFSMAVLISMLFTSLVVLSSCNNDDAKDCQGYTGKVTDARADSLVNRCHFLSKDSIEKWVAQYEQFKSQLERKPDYQTNPNDPANAKAAEMKAQMDEISTSFLKGGSVSYNNCIIRKILCDKNSIGLRVLYGIGGDNRIHIILVGINPDYSNLYVDGEDCCAEPLNKKLGAQASDATSSGKKGGAEYGQMP